MTEAEQTPVQNPPQPPKTVALIQIEVREDGSVYTAPFKISQQVAPTLIANLLDTVKTLNASFANYSQDKILRLSTSLLERIEGDKNA